MDTVTRIFGPDCGIPRLVNGAIQVDFGDTLKEVPTVGDGVVVHTVNAQATEGAITQKAGVVVLTHADAGAYTLADPTNPDDDGKELTLIAGTAMGHKVSNSAGSGYNGGGGTLDTLTFGGALGDSAVLIAYAGKWYTKSLRNVTITAS